MCKNRGNLVFPLLISIGLRRRWLPTTLPRCKKAACKFPPNRRISRHSRDISQDASGEVVPVHGVKVFTEDYPQHLLTIIEGRPQLLHDLLTQDLVLP